MQPEKTLRADQYAIRDMTRILDDLSGRLREGHDVAGSDLNQVIGTLDSFVADAYRPRQSALFGLLREHVDDVDPDELGAIEEGHQQAQAMLTESREEVEAAAGGDERARRRLDAATNRYQDAMTAILDREGPAFLTDLDSLLDRRRLDELADRFEQISDEAPDRGRAVGTVARIASRYAGRRR